jgi:hypothetical protein
MAAGSGAGPGANASLAFLDLPAEVQQAVISHVSQRAAIDFFS